MATLFDSWDETGINTNTSIYGTRFYTQSFGATGTYTVNSIEWYGSRALLPGECFIEIYATDPADLGKPTGAALASQAFDADTVIGTSDAWNSITFDAPYEVTRGTTYAILLRAPNGDVSNDLDWRSDSTSAYDPGTQMWSFDGGSSWTITGGNNDTLPFKVNGTSGTPTVANVISAFENTPVGTNVDLTDWQAQVFTAGSTVIAIGVDLSLYATSGSTATLTIALYPTNGSGEPDTSAAALASKTFAASALTSLANRPNPWITADFTTNPTIVSGTKYAIVVSSDTNEVKVKMNRSTDPNSPYTGGEAWSTADSGSTWTVVSGGAADFAFKLYVFNTVGVTPSDLNYDKHLVAVASNEVWWESTSGTMAEITAANGDIDCSKELNIFEGYGKVFVANDSNLKVADFSSVKITTTNIGANPPDPGTILTGGTSAASMVVDYVTSLSGASVIYGLNITDFTFAAETVTGTDDDGNAISFTGTAEVAPPHWYDWTAFGASATFGVLPNKATLGALFRGRAVISGNPEAPHQWYMSRQASPFDFLYGVNDAQAAVAGNNADAGEIGDIVTAVIPYKDDFLIFGCASTMWYLTGDPTSGGSLDELDLTTGIFGAQSWCWGEDGELYFWGVNGIYKVKLPGGVPQCISQIRLPKLVDDEAADPSTHRIVMSYDKRRAGIHISVTLMSDGSNSCYWYDLRTDGFFPESYPDECGIFSSIEYEAVDPAFKQVMYGCKDGFIRFADDSEKDDDAGASGDTAVSSYVTFGPFLLSNLAMNEGKIIGLDVILGADVQGSSQSDSDSVSYELYTGKSAKEVLEKMVDGTPIAAAGTVTGSGRSRNTFRRKVRGVYGGLKLKNVTAAETWALEQILIDVAKAGRLK
ncbi:MAG: hypothetical protein FVQ80_11040 [Planctomycetes bacterium]|nr:hypothetical protein [Planctomycetota bacterium]